MKFYLHRKENSYLIKTTRKLDLVYGTKEELINNELAREIYFGNDFMKEEIR